MENKLVILILFSIAFIQCGKETSVNRFINYDQLVKKNYITKGWIPQIIPTNSYDIIEKHDIDTNELVGIFYYKSFKEIHSLSGIPKDEILKDLDKLNNSLMTDWFIKNEDFINKNTLIFKTYNHFQLIADTLEKKVYFFSLGNN